MDNARECYLERNLSLISFPQVDGKMLAQSNAMEHYAAKLAGLYPEDM